MQISSPVTAPLDDAEESTLLASNFTVRQYRKAAANKDPIQLPRQYADVLPSATSPPHSMGRISTDSPKWRSHVSCLRRLSPFCADGKRAFVKARTVRRVPGPRARLRDIERTGFRFLHKRSLWDSPSGRDDRRLANRSPWRSLRWQPNDQRRQIHPRLTESVKCPLRRTEENHLGR